MKHVKKIFWGLLILNGLIVIFYLVNSYYVSLHLKKASDLINKSNNVTEEEFVRIYDSITKRK